MNKNSLKIYIIFIIIALCLITVSVAFIKPAINKTMVLQIQKFVK